MSNLNVRTSRPHLGMLARIAADPGRAAGVPWRADDVLPLPQEPYRPRTACHRSGRSGMMQALLRRGLLARDRNGLWLLTAAGLALADPNAVDHAHKGKGL